MAVITYQILRRIDGWSGDERERSKGLKRMRSESLVLTEDGFQWEKKRGKYQYLQVFFS